MRQLKRLVWAMALAGLVAGTGCRRQHPLTVETVEEEGPPLVSVVHVADPRATPQLLRGFYDIEHNSWRWTMGKFSVTLRPPAGAATKGATLQLNLTMPEPVISRLRSVTLSASIRGVALDPETYTKPGDHVYRRDVPAASLAAEAVTIDFALDKYLAAGAVEQRELGVIVTQAGLIPK